MDVLDYQLLYASFFTASEERNLNTPDPSTGLMGAHSHPGQAPLGCRRWHELLAALAGCAMASMCDVRRH